MWFANKIGGAAWVEWGGCEWCIRTCCGPPALVSLYSVSRSGWGWNAPCSFATAFLSCEHGRKATSDSRCRSGWVPDAATLQLAARGGYGRRFGTRTLPQANSSERCCASATGRKRSSPWSVDGGDRGAGGRYPKAHRLQEADPGPAHGRPRRRQYRGLFVVQPISRLVIWWW